MNELYESRIEIVRNTRYSNCIGTALYLAGVRPEETYLEPDKARKEVERMDRLEKPIPGAIAVWMGEIDNWIYHMAIVTEAGEEVFVTHRKFHRGPLLEEDSLIEAGRIYDKLDIEVRYFMPKPFGRCEVPQQNLQPLWVTH